MLHNFVFNRHDTVGANAAEEDADYLFECFVDMEELPIIKDDRDHRFLVVGRTGSGKTALFMQLAEDCDNCYPIDANAKGFCFTERISILEELSDKGINLSPYLKLLWTHVLAIEIIQETIPVDHKDTIMDRLKSIFVRKGKVKEENALRYLKEYQGHFWMETTERLRLITEKFTQDLENATRVDAEAQAKFGVFSAGIGSSYEDGEATSYTRQTTYAIEQRGIETICQNLANKISTIPKVIDALLNDKGRIMYVAIDKLDESVISDTFRYQSLRGLIDAIRDLNRDVEKLKIVVSLRTDLLDCILRKIKNPGQQYEKYKSLFLQIRWNRKQLIDLAEKRVHKLVKKRYQPKSVVSLRELFPEKIHTTENKVVSFEDYIIERSWNRPRDIIDFINFCIKQAEGNEKVTQDMVRQAEKQYSKDRYSSLQEEWQKTIPEIKILLDLLVGFAVEFNVSSIDEDKTIDWVHAVLCSEELSSPLYCLASEYDKQSVNYTTFRNKCLQLLYDAGAIGIKFSSSDPLRWSYQEDYAYVKDDIRENSSVRIHPGLWAFYGICE